MRKLIATVAVAVAGTFAVAAPSQAATSCKTYKLPSKAVVMQSNATFVLQFTNGYWSVAGKPGAEVNMPARLTMPKVFKFIITWPNGAGGVYTGYIDADGFVSGTTYDRWKPSSRATWKLSRLAQCVY